MNTVVLEELGLTKAEIKVYIALLELGLASAGNIATKSRTTSSKIYEVLAKLLEKGLANMIIQNKIKKFSPNSPRFLLQYVAEQQEKIQEQRQAVETLIPQLEQRAELAQIHSESRVYLGIDAIKAACIEAGDRLQNGEEAIGMSIPKRTDAMNIFFSKLVQKLHKRGVRMRAIFCEEAREDLQAQVFSDIAACKFQKDISPAAINVFGDQVLIFPEGTLTPTMFVIDNPVVAQSFKEQFTIQWELAEE